MTPRRFAAVVFALWLAASPVRGAEAPLWSDALGSGEPTIVLIHGVGGDRREWDRVLPSLTAAHRVVRVELPGHGASPPLARVTVKDIARAVDRVLRERRVEHAVLVGHSYGAWVALEEAAAQPARAAAVVVLDMGSYTPTDTARVNSLEVHLKEHYASLIPLIFQDMSMDPVDADSAVARAMQLPPDVMRAYLRDSWREDLRGRIKGMKTPVHLVATDETWPAGVPWERARGQFGYQTAGPVTGYRITQSAHLIMLDRPDTLATILSDISAKVVAKAR